MTDIGETVIPDRVPPICIAAALENAAFARLHLYDMDEGLKKIGEVEGCLEQEIVADFVESTKNLRVEAARQLANIKATVETIGED